MTTRFKDENKRYILQKAYEKHAAAIQAALKSSQVPRREIVTLSNGVKLFISHTSQGYQVAGLCQESPLELHKAEAVGSRNQLERAAYDAHGTR